MRVIGLYIDGTPYCWDCARDVLTPEDREECAAIFSDTETDSPEHCARCKELIPHALTDAGFQYVLEAIRGLLIGKSGSPDVLASWWREYNQDIDTSDVALFGRTLIQDLLEVA